MKAIICPISSRKIDSNVSRLTIFFNVVLIVGFLLTLNPILIFIVTGDYFIRAALDFKYSPIRLGALGLIKVMNLKEKPINLAQKVFASRLGFLVALSSLVLVLTGFVTASFITAALLMSLSIMDSVFKICLGCIIYNFLVYPFYKNK